MRNECRIRFWELQAGEYGCHAVWSLRSHLSISGIAITHGWPGIAQGGEDLSSEFFEFGKSFETKSVLEIGFSEIILLRAPLVCMAPSEILHCLPSRASIPFVIVA